MKCPQDNATAVQGAKGATMKRQCIGLYRRQEARQTTKDEALCGSMTLVRISDAYRYITRSISGYVHVYVEHVDIRELGRLSTRSTLPSNL